MQTTCPECRTTYRITQAQLSLRRGLVRCGHCTTVFNAYDSLLPDLGSDPEEPTPVPATSRSQRPASRPSVQEQEPASLTEVVHLGQNDEEPEPSAHQEPPFLTPAPWTEPTAPLPPEQAEEQREQVSAPPPSPEAPPATTLPSLLQAAEETSDDILLSELPVHRDDPAEAVGRPWRSALYGLLALVLLAVLTFQITFLLRSEIAQTWPATRPLLTRGCQQIGCTVSLPQLLGKEAVISSSLEHDPENRSRVRLSLLLANRTGQAQSWPQIVLTLTDVRDNPLGQTRFKPREYLPKGTDPAKGMPADSEWEVRLDLEIGNLDASGYTLDLIHQ